jgi:predicted transcriptional regulator
MRLTVKVEDEIVTTLGRLATTSGRSYAELVEAALREYLERNPPPPMPERRV